MWFYKVARVLVTAFYRLLFRPEVIGAHHVPEQGGVILCSNHISNWDPPMIGFPLSRRVHFMAKEELFRIPGLNVLIRILGAFPVKRGGVSKESIKYSIELLKQGNVIGIFPEGSRRNAGGMGKKGAAMLALKSGATVIPVSIVGDYKPFRRMTLIYGEPVDLSEFASGNGDLDGATEKIMETIRQLPNRYGVKQT